ncbi:PQQ-binding-like beta-propeller repeat protein [Kribbella sp. NPDC051952]|uniref:outer membrane protein assembly factor BamB family protein n=1 Tax=Kribbella sp. NPDC051952 TaxID=3154851 RepID=UPI0034162785
MAGLRELWRDVVPDAGALADELVARYTQKGRNAYRDRYVGIVLTALEALDQLSTDAAAVELAVWFHRADHESGWTPTEDAEASARLAERLLPAYGVSPARTAEVARLVRLTGGIGEIKAQDANADVLLDAVNAVLASDHYITHAAEVRRDAERGTESPEPFTEVKRRYDEVRKLLKSPIYRTGHAQERFEADARANLEAEYATLDALLPAPWRGWQRAALVVGALVTALVAFVAAFGAARSPWRVPEYDEDSVWPSVVLTVLALCAVPTVYWCATRSARSGRIVAGLVIAAGVVAAVAVWIVTPETSEGSGVGQRVPLMVASAVLLVVAGAAALGASLLTRDPVRPRNRGQVLAGFGAVAVIVLATIFVINPVQRAYLLSANEQLEGQHQPAGQNVRSELTGEVGWTTAAGRASDSLRDMVATRFGIAVSRQIGTIEMLDPATGQVRWRYARADSDVQPRLYAVSGGQALLADFDDLGYFVLDADTGRRTAAWPGRTKDYTIDNLDPLVTGRTVSKGSDKLYGTNVDGSNRWTYEPGTCTGISAAATADTVVAHLSRSCGDPDELVGLNLKNGKQLWSHQSTSLGGLTAVGGSVVGVEPESGSPVSGRGMLVGVQPRSGDVKWRWPMPTTWACPPKVETAGNFVVLISCPSKAEVYSGTVATAIDADTGRVVWTATMPARYGDPYAVTTDGRLIFMNQVSDTCQLTSLSEHKTTQLPKSIKCDRGIVAAGNQLLAISGRSIVALR